MDARSADLPDGHGRRLSFRALGPLHTEREDDHAVDIISGAERRIVTALAVRAGGVVSPEELVVSH